MQQTSYRSALGGHVTRPPGRGVHGINSRVQDTAWLLSHVAQPASADATPSRRARERRRHGHSGAFSGINSRVQDTAWLLSHVGQPAPAAARGVYRRSDGSLGSLGFLDPITQGVIIGMGTEWALRAMNTDPQLEELERQARIDKAAKALSRPMEHRGVVGYDKFIYVDPKPFQYTQNGLGGLGQDISEYFTQGQTTQGGFRLPSGGSTTQAAVGTGLAVTSSAIASGSSLASSATWLAAAGGPIGLAVAGVTIALTALFSRKKPGQKRATTEIVDSVEPMMQQNLAGYMSGPHTVSSQYQALQNFDAGWDYVVKSCGIAEMGTPGKWCIDDRKPGGQWDWFARYRDPIANDPNVVPDPGLVAEVDPVTGQTVYRAQATGGGNLTPLLIAGVLAFVALQM